MVRTKKWHTRRSRHAHIYVKLIAVVICLFKYSKMLFLIIILDFSCTVTFPEKNSLHSFNLTPYAAETGEGEEVEKQGNWRTYQQLNHHLGFYYRTADHIYCGNLGNLPVVKICRSIPISYPFFFRKYLQFILLRYNICTIYSCILWKEAILKG